MVELYGFPNSICAQKVLITLLEKGLECEKHDINLFVGAQYLREFT
jgi:glutathione S-transferase